MTGARRGWRAAAVALVLAVPVLAGCEAAQKLDQRLREVDDADVRQAGEELRDRVRELADAARNASAADAQKALGDVEAAARRLASTCGVDAGQVGGG